ncbi:MAG: alpha/beta hydrolase [Candidatus Thorarchaeota archaeon]|nr:alpha/beta hydrolase [Candidatus Thorarchaeota archaeon]
MTVHYEESGKGKHPTIVMVHGAGGSSVTWFMQLRGLGREVHVKALDLNGHGATPDRNEKDIFRSYLNDIDTVVEESDRPVLMGHSMGGALSLLYALENPDKMAGLILVGTGARLRVADFIFDLLDNDFEGYVNAVGQYMFAGSTSKQLIEASQQEVRKCPVEIIHRDFDACNRFDVMKRLAEIKVPTLIIVGEDDMMTPVKYAAYLHEHIPHSEFVVIKDAGHSVMLERPAEMNRAIIDWIRKNVVQ